jgi:hypothetical protein
MLGAARASQYAGWWNTGLTSVAFSSTSTLGTEIYQSPTYSWLLNDSNRSLQEVDNGTVDLTGITGLTGYNNLRSARVINFYLPSSEWTSAAAGGFPVAAGWDLYDGATRYAFGQQISLVTSGAIKLVNMNALFGSFNGQVSAQLPGTHTQYLDTWLTVVATTAETSSVYTNWTGPTQSTNTQACRVAVFNTATGVLIAKNDDWRNSTTSTPAWPTLSTITNPLPMTTGAAWYVLYRANANAGYQTRLGSNWFGLGTMFDPLSETNTSWRTALPTETVGNAQSWMNMQFSRYQDAGAVFPKFYGNASGQDLYSESSNRQIEFQASDQTGFDAGYSDTIIIKDSS